MPITDAKRRSNKRWNDAHMKERYDRIQLVVSKGKRDDIKAYADGKAMTVSEYIKSLISADMGGVGL